MSYSLIKKALFCLNPERAHDITLRQLRRITGTPFEWLIRQSVPTKPVECMGLSFKNPVGLAAGMDKNGECIDAFSAMGFGFIEVGTVTPLAQAGNDKPRLFRITPAEALINQMGFNNQGVDQLISNVKKAQFGGVIGINIGKNSDTPFEKSAEDYLICMEKIYPHAGYIAINISSPNTAELRSLQYGSALDDLLNALKNKQLELQAWHNKYVPLAVKIDPDLSEEEINSVVLALIKYNIDGVIATNTTLKQRDLIKGLDFSGKVGGLSGRPLQNSSTKTIAILARELKKQGKEKAISIIGAGGVDSLIAAREKIAAGATVVQIYTGLIFHGPRLVKHIITYI